MTWIFHIEPLVRYISCLLTSVCTQRKPYGEKVGDRGTKNNSLFNHPYFEHGSTSSTTPYYQREFCFVQAGKRLAYSTSSRLYSLTKCVNSCSHPPFLVEISLGNDTRSCFYATETGAGYIWPSMSRLLRVVAVTHAFGMAGMVGPYTTQQQAAANVFL